LHGDVDAPAGQSGVEVGRFARAGVLRARISSLILLIAFLLAAGFALANLGAQILWQDEAQSALLARTTLANGIPHGFDGANSLSQELGIEIDPDGRWRWHTWLHFYLVAGAFALLGESSVSARLPGALAGLATVPVLLALARAQGRARAVELAAVVTLVGLVPFWILARQCRYYSLGALASTAALLGYARLVRSHRGGAPVLVASLVALFHVHYVYVPPLVAALGVHAAIFHRAAFLRVARASAIALVVCAPWIVWQSGMRYSANYADELADPTIWLSNAEVFARRLLAHASGLAGLVACAVALVVSFARGGRAAVASALSDERAWLVALPALAIFATLAVVSPGPFFRYLAPILPLVAMGYGLVCAALARVHGLLAAIAVAAFLALQPLASFAYELTHDFDGPLEGLVAFLNDHAQPSDVVWITYGDMPLKFHTRLRVVGGLAGDDLSAALRDEPPDWIVIRNTTIHAARDGAVRSFIEAHIDLAGFRKIELPFTDTAFENREEPGEHRFRSARGGPPVVVYERTRDPASDEIGGMSEGDRTAWDDSEVACCTGASSH